MPRTTRDYFDSSGGKVQKFSFPLSPAAITVFPSGQKTTDVADSVGPLSTANSAPVLDFQILTTPSSYAEVASNFPSALNAKAKTSRLSAGVDLISRLLVVSQNRSDLSSLPEASILPSGL